MSNITLINYTTRDFISKTELDLFISKQDTFYSKTIIAQFKNAGLVRRVVTRIWNREGAYRVGILFEYTGEKPIKIVKDFWRSIYYLILKILIQKLLVLGVLLFMNFNNNISEVKLFILRICCTFHS